MSDALELIRAERARQQAVEGWTPAHDDRYRDDELLRAAGLYLFAGTVMEPALKDGTPEGWPWDAEWWKPKDRRSNLIRAGALCLAEMDRRVRAHRRVATNIQHKLRRHPSTIPALDTADVDERLTQIVHELENLADTTSAATGGVHG